MIPENCQAQIHTLWDYLPAQSAVLLRFMLITHFITMPAQITKGLIDCAMGQARRRSAAACPLAQLLFQGNAARLADMRLSKWFHLGPILYSEKSLLPVGDLESTPAPFPLRVEKQMIALRFGPPNSDYQLVIYPHHASLSNSHIVGLSTSRPLLCARKCLSTRIERPVPCQPCTLPGRLHTQGMGG